MGKRIVIIGAGSTNFGLKIIGDFYKSQILKGSTIVLHDIRPEAVEKTRKIAENYKEKLQVDFQIEATTSREEALKVHQSIATTLLFFFQSFSHLRTPLHFDL